MSEWTEERLAEAERVISQYVTTVCDERELRAYDMHCGDNYPSAVAEIRRLQEERACLSCKSPNGGAYCADCMAAVLAKAEPAWRPASEPPDNGRDVLVYQAREGGEWNIEVECFNHETNMWCGESDRNRFGLALSHWRELPEPPK